MISPKYCVSAMLAITLMAGTAAASDKVACGKIKSIDAANKSFILTDSASKDHTFALGENLIINRAGAVSKSDLQVGDAIYVSYQKGVFTWTARYVLVQEGVTAHCTLLSGNVKAYDTEKDELTFTSDADEVTHCRVGATPITINKAAAAIGAVKIGDHALLIMHDHKGKQRLKSMMIDRANGSESTAAGETVASGVVKSIDAENKSFVLVDSFGKDHTFKIADNLVVNRDGLEGKSDLKAADTIAVCYTRGMFTWMAHYILVQAASTKNSQLIWGSIKGYDATAKTLAFTSEHDKESSYAMGAARVRVNMADAKVEDIVIGDHALLIVDIVEGESTLLSVIVGRKE
jgi:Cu/Ag efflux protein CusF